MFPKALVDQPVVALEIADQYADLPQAKAAAEQRLNLSCRRIDLGLAVRGCNEFDSRRIR